VPTAVAQYPRPDGGTTEAAPASRLNTRNPEWNTVRGPDFDDVETVVSVARYLLLLTVVHERLDTPEVVAAHVDEVTDLDQSGADDLQPGIRPSSTAAM
jgi:hypothetical protein